MLRFCVRKRVLGAIAVVAAFCFTGIARASEPGSPEETIEHFNAAIVEAMAFDRSAGVYSRYQILHDAVGEAFDMEVLGRATINIVYWRTWTPQQKSEYVRALQRYQSAALADRFESGKGISFVIDRTIDVPRGGKIVETRIIRPKKDDEDIGLDYRMLKRSDRWRIIDVYLDSRISEVAMRRSEYSQVIRDEGFDGLIAALEKQTQQILGKSYQPE